MKRCNTVSTDSRHSASGFTLIEMATVMAIMMVASAITFISLQPALKQQRVGNAYNTVLAALRQARDNAVAQRTSYSVTFNTTSTPHTVTVAPTFTGFQGALRSVTYSLPDTVKFKNESGIPTSNQFTPDRFGVGAAAVDLGFTGQGTGVGGQSVVYFCPDGSAQDAAGGVGQCSGNLSDGVIYIARPGDLMSSRAITIWGATGRIRGWRLYNNGAGGTVWQRQ